MPYLGLYLYIVVRLIMFIRVLGYLYTFKIDVWGRNNVIYYGKVRLRPLRRFYSLVRELLSPVGNLSDTSGVIPLSDTAYKS